MQYCDKSEIMEEPKWKTRPKSFPNNENNEPSIIELNQFDKKQDQELDQSELKRTVSFHTVEQTPFKTRINPRLLRARDSIFVTHDHLKAHHEQEDEDDEDEDKESFDQQSNIIENSPITLRRPALNVTASGSKKSNRNSQVRFSDIPIRKINSDYDDDIVIEDVIDEDEDEHKHEQSQQPQYQQVNSFAEIEDESDQHWQLDSSDDDGYV